MIWARFRVDRRTADYLAAGEESFVQNLQSLLGCEYFFALYSGQRNFISRLVILFLFLGSVAFLAVSVRAAQPNENHQLFDDVFETLTNFSKANPEQLREVTGEIILDCEGATSEKKMFYRKLIEILPAYKLGLENVEEPALNIVLKAFPSTNTSLTVQATEISKTNEEAHIGQTTNPEEANQKDNQQKPKNVSNVNTNTVSTNLDIKNEPPFIFTNHPSIIIANLSQSTYTNLTGPIPDSIRTNLIGPVFGNPFSSALVTSSGNASSLSNSYSGLTIQVGLVTLNPYSISHGTNGPNDFELNSDNSSSRLIVQVNYVDRWAWNYFGPDVDDWMIKKWAGWDFQARGAYTFGANTTSGSTIIGSGDLTLEAWLGKQVWRRRDQSRLKTDSINVEFGVSTTTDRGFLETHSTLFLGPAYVVSFAPPWTKNQEAFF